jgi:hypothetical protein
MSRAQAFRWHKMFSEGREQFEDKQRTGRPSTARTGDNIAWERELVRSHRRLTVQMTAEKTNMNWETVHLILTEELGIKTVVLPYS